MAIQGKLSRRQIRILIAFAVALLIAGWSLWSDWQQRQNVSQSPPPASSANLASTALGTLPIKGRAPKTGYSRNQFWGDWANSNGCSSREHILARDLTQVKLRSTTDCTVLTGVLNDPYTGKSIQFTRGPDTSGAVQIDHVVAIGDAWQKGAQQLSFTERVQLYNDPLELLAVDGPTNEQKGDGDAATWLPPNKSYRCRYVARQIAVKVRYRLWVTQAEHDAMQRVLGSCPAQQLPVQSAATGA